MGSSITTRASSSRLELLVSGTQPLLLGSSVSDDNVTLAVDLTNTDIYREGHLDSWRASTLHIVRTICLWQGTAHQRIAVTNHGREPVACAIAFLYGNDFADIFEVRRATAR